MSLHKTVEMLKKVALGIVAFILLLFIINLIAGLIVRLIPKKQVPPTVSFGKLPALTFPHSADVGNSPTYILNTVSGDFPVLPDRVTVYQIQQSQANLLALRNFQKLIPPYEFPNQPKAITDTIYQWSSPNPPFKIITFNTLSQDLSVASSYITDPDFYNTSQTQDQAGAISAAKGFLQNFNEYPDDIDDAKTQTTLYTIDSTSHTLQPALSLAASQVIEVDFFEQDVDKIPIYYPDPTHSLVSALVSNNTVVSAQSIHKPIIQPSTATYPIKTAAQAFKELQDGKAYIASPSNPPAASINIRNISLGYYIGSGTQYYLMPVIVMQGDNGFYAYASAVTDQWIQ